LAKKGYDPDFGARPLSRIMQEEIKDVLADKLLAGKLDKGKKILIDVDEQQQGLKFDVV
jgi:ATP-dependent Clp protease ATP-binding subunit ClpA